MLTKGRKSQETRWWVGETGTGDGTNRGPGLRPVFPGPRRLPLPVVALTSTLPSKSSHVLKFLTSKNLDFY